MYTQPMIFPLDLQGEIYLLQDEKGNTVGTGTRQVCEVLLHIITKPLTRSASPSTEILVSQKHNVRAAITL